MRTANQQHGDAAEDQVARHLVAAGWRILGRQVRVGRAELDLIAIDPRPPMTLVTVEVRFRGRRDFGLPEETVDRRKVARLRTATHELRTSRALPDGTPVPPLSIRLDLVVLEPGRPLRHHRHIG